MGWTVMLKTLRRNGAMPVLVIAQVMFALVVLVNVGSLLYQQMAPVLAPTGVPAGQVVITRMILAGNVGLPAWNYARIRTEEQAVRAMPGVKAVSAGMGAPFAVDGLPLAVQPTAVQSHRTAHADVFAGDHVIQALGLHVLRGRAFGTDDYVRGGPGKAIGLNGPQSALISASLARQLFPHGHAVGQLIRLFVKPKAHQNPLRVIGIVGDTLRSRLMHGGPTQMNNVVLTPVQVDGSPFVAFMLRVSPSRRNAVMKRLPAVLGAALGIHGTDDAIKVHSYEAARDDALHGNRTAAWMLAVVLGVVTIVVVLGIAGLNGFWVQKRIHDIGVRRALGARRGDILRDYHLENLLVVGVGVVLGVGVGLLVSTWLRTHFELSAPSEWAWVLGALVLLGFGQLAVLGPALRASRVPPVVATRSV